MVGCASRIPPYGFWAFDVPVPTLAKVFCFFFSKKKRFLLAPSGGSIGHDDGGFGR
jgi:hypothetical protein